MDRKILEILGEVLYVCIHVLSAEGKGATLLMNDDCTAASSQTFLYHFLELAVTIFLKRLSKKSVRLYKL